MFETERFLKNSTYSEWRKTNGRSWILSGRSELLRIAVVGAGAIGCLFGGRLQEAGQSVLLIHNGTGITWVGEMNCKHSKRGLAVKRAFQEAGFSTVVSNNINGVLWTKAVVNSAINPVTAIARVRNRDVLKTPELLEIASKVIDESSAVA